MVCSFQEGSCRKKGSTLNAETEVSICVTDGHLRSAEFDQRTREIPGKKLLSAVDRVIGNPPQHLAKVEFWIERVELGCPE